MKKILIAAVLGYLFFQGVSALNNFVNEEFFDEYYTRDYGNSANNEDSTWDKIVKYFDGFFDKEEKEQYIYK